MQYLKKITATALALATIVSAPMQAMAAEAVKTTDDLTIFVGDSRTVGLKNAVDSKNEDDCYIAKVGMGYKWFTSTAAPELQKTIDANKDKNIKVVINFGVNDLGNVNKYSEYVNSLDDNKTDNVQYYYMSVNPVKSYPTVNNTQISKFNEKLKSSLNEDVVWVDTYTDMQTNGFSSPDGLHYSSSTYEDIYEYVSEAIN